MPRRAKRDKKLQQARRPLQPIDPNARVARNAQEPDKPAPALVLSPNDSDDVFQIQQTAQQLLVTFAARTGSQQLREATGASRQPLSLLLPSSDELPDAQTLLHTFHARTGPQQLQEAPPAAREEQPTLLPSSDEPLDVQTLLRTFNVRAGQQQQLREEQPTPRSARRLLERRGREQLLVEQTPTRRRTPSPRIEQHQEEQDAPRPPSSNGSEGGIPEEERGLEDLLPATLFYYSRDHRGRKCKAGANIARGALDPTVDYRSVLGACNRPCGFCDALHWIDEKLANSTRRTPAFNCCAQGSVHVPLQLDFPERVLELLAGHERHHDRARRTHRSEEFHRLIRHYNNAFSFCSLGTSFDRALAQQLGGAYTFRIHGALHHSIGALHPAGSAAPAYAQLYVFDGFDEQLERRGQAFHNLDPGVLRTIQEVLLELHPYVQALRNNAARIRADRSVTIRIGIEESGSMDPRTYNRPSVQEVAALIPVPTDDTAYSTRHIVLQNAATGRLQYISERTREYNCLRYPFLFPYGEPGWHYNFPRAGARWPPQATTTATATARERPEDGTQDELYDDGLSGVSQEPEVRLGRNGCSRVTQQQWWRYALQVRTPLLPTLYAGRLFHELAVDAFASILMARLKWHRENQQVYRMARAAGLVDALACEEMSTSDVGQRVILPASFTGGPRQMHNAYLDAMALTRHFSAPDYFITFTCNTTWTEILRELKPGQGARDRPDLVNRVFQLKLHQLQRELVRKGVLGKVAAMVWTIEFQKRGLPHAHILLIMDPASKPRTVEDVDDTICAELPDERLEPLLHDVVTRFMLHHPCGTANPRASCMRDGCCRWSFPKAFQEETVLANGRPVYRRRDNGRTHTKGVSQFKYDNRYVASYNKYLSVRFNAHVNVESCQGYSGVKYVYKYVYKGSDRATTSLAVPRQGQEQAGGAQQGPVDEIKEYIDTLYVSCHEALWRITEFKTHGRTVPVQQLQIHLEGQQTVMLRPDVPLAEQEAQVYKDTTLTAFFAENARAQTDILYHDFPTHYTWQAKAKAWRLRKRGFAVGRITWIPVTAGEAYYLRRLLVNVSGQRSFEDARTYQGIVHLTFKAACLARGLLEDDREWEQALEEAGSFKPGRQLRALFITILTFCEPADPGRLWERFRGVLADDCAHLLRTQYSVRDPSQEQAEDLALFFLYEAFTRRNGDGRCWQLPRPQRQWAEVGGSIANRLVREQRAFDADELATHAAQNRAAMNEQQQFVFDTVSRAVDAASGGLFFLDGPGGTGKTFVQNTMLAHQRAQGRIALAVASTGIAATLLDSGTTAHSRFKIPVTTLDQDSTCAVPRCSDLAELLQSTSLILWDEAVMTHRHAIEAVSRTLQDLRDDDDPRQARPFGGITVCFCGDFRQILPVIKGASRAQIVGASIRRSVLWRHVHVLRLVENMRLRRPGLGTQERLEITAFAERLLAVGERTDPDGCVFWEPRDQALGNDVRALTVEIYPNLHRRIPDPQLLQSSAILAPTNDAVAATNALLLDAMPGPAQTFTSVDAGDAETGGLYPDELLHSLSPPELPPHKLQLKIGAPVILLRNLDAGNGLCNGTRLRVEHLSPRVLRCSILGTSRHGAVVQLPRIPLASSGTDEIKFTRRQFPVKLAFAMTINKAQGQSFSRVGLLLDPGVFSHGQLYVALSRVTSPDGIRMCVPATDPARAGRIKNVVYPEVLS